jgi:hypothetical protein
MSLKPKKNKIGKLTIREKHSVKNSLKITNIKVYTQGGKPPVLMTKNKAQKYLKDEIEKDVNKRFGNDGYDASVYIEQRKYTGSTSIEVVLTALSEDSGEDLHWKCFDLVENVTNILETRFENVSHSRDNTGTNPDEELTMEFEIS